MYPVIEVSDDAAELPEQLGTKPKFWFRMPDSSRWLFKEVRPGTGEHWSEKACAEIAGLFDLPRAPYELAVWRGRNGVVSKTFVPPGARLVLGNEVLFRVVPGYPNPAVKKFRAREHTLVAILAFLRAPGILLPLGFQGGEGIETCADMFLGYIMLDALIANQDRHHENWGFVVTPEPRIHLAPTFDHGSSLGRNERDEVRLERLNTRDKQRSVAHYVERATSALYASGTTTRALGTVEAFEEGAKIRPKAARFWLDRLNGVADTDFARIFREFPAHILGEPATNFALGMLQANRRRLLATRIPIS